MKKLTSLNDLLSILLIVLGYLIVIPMANAQECEGEYFFLEPGGCVLCEEGFTLVNMLGTDCYKCVREDGLSILPERCEDPIPTAATVHMTIKTNGNIKVHRRISLYVAAGRNSYCWWTTISW